MIDSLSHLVDFSLQHMNHKKVIQMIANEEKKIELDIKSFIG